MRNSGDECAHFRCLLLLDRKLKIQFGIKMIDVKERITIDPEQCRGRPCIRGMRIRVIDVLDLYAAGLSAQEIREEMPDLEMEDLTAALRYAAQRLDHPVIAA